MFKLSNHTLSPKVLSTSSLFVSFGRTHPPATLLFDNESDIPSVGETDLANPNVLVFGGDSFGIMKGDDFTPVETFLVSDSVKLGFDGISSFASQMLFLGDC